MIDRPTGKPLEPETLLFETSPFGSVDAMVEQDHRAAYLYLHAPNHPEFGTRAVWIRNLIKGPLVLSEEEMRMGIPPVLPRTYCASPDGCPPLISDRLQFVWFEEGNGVALLDDEEMVAVIPPWSGLEGFHGYALECRTENQICWPMPQQPHLLTRIRRAAQYWNQWELGNPFKAYQAEMLERLESNFKKTTGYFSIDGGKWPPRGVQVYEDDIGKVAFTIGLGLCAMPNAELSTDNPSSIRRTELAMRIPVDADQETLLRWLSGLCHFPWQKFTWFGHGHTSLLPEGLFSGAAGIYFCDNRARELPIPVGQYQDDPVNLLWLVPISSEELERLRENDDASRNFANELKQQGRL